MRDATRPKDEATRDALPVFYPGFAFDAGPPTPHQRHLAWKRGRRGPVDWSNPKTPASLKASTRAALAKVLLRIYDRRARGRLRPDYSTMELIPPRSRTVLAGFSQAVAQALALAFPRLSPIQVRTLALHNAARALDDWLDRRSGRPGTSAAGKIEFTPGPTVAGLFGAALGGLSWNNHGFAFAVLDQVDVAIDDELVPRCVFAPPPITTIFRPPTGGTVERHH